MCFARASLTIYFLTLSLIARGELRCGVVEAGSDFAKRLPSANGVVVGSYISEYGYDAQDSDRVGSCGRWLGCANNGVGSWRWRWWRRRRRWWWWWPRRRRWRHGRWRL